MPFYWTFLPFFCYTARMPLFSRISVAAPFKSQKHHIVDLLQLFFYKSSTNPANLLLGCKYSILHKKRLHHRYFLENFVKFWRQLLLSFLNFLSTTSSKIHMKNHFVRDYVIQMNMWIRPGVTFLGTSVCSTRGWLLIQRKGNRT